MGKRSDRRIFRRRRQRVGLILFVSMVVVVFGAMIFLRTDPAATSDEGPIIGVDAPAMEEAAVAAPDQEAIREAEEQQAAAEQARQERAEQAAAEKKAAEEKAAREERQREREEKARAAAENPPDPANSDMWLDVPKLGLYDNYVANSSDPAALDVGAAKLEESGFPWQPSANTYIAAHRLGWPGTASDHQFYNLPNLAYGDKIYLTDSNGTVYTYEVTEIFEILPSESWVTGPEAGRDMISLQTCIEDYGDYWTMGPNWYVRYVVRADRVDVEPYAI